MKKYALFFLMSIALFPLYATATINNKEIIEENKKGIGVDSCPRKLYGNEKFVGRSRCWRACEALLPEGMTWPNVVKTYGNGSGQPTDLWTPALQLMAQEQLKKVDTTPPPDPPPRDIGKKIAKLGRFIHTCHALITLSTHSNYDDDSVYTNGGIVIKTSAVNPNLVCRADGHDTQDYPTCTKLVTAYDGFFLAGQANKMIQGFRMEDHANKEKDKMIEKRLRRETIGAKDGLETQKRSIDKMGQMAGERAMLSGAETAVLIGLATSMPTVKSLLKKCASQMKGKKPEYISLMQQSFATLASKVPSDTTLQNIVNGAESEAKQMFGDSPKEVCKTPFDMGINLILNQTAKGIALQAATKAGFDAIAQMYKKNLLKKRSKGIESALKKIDEFKPEDWTPPEETTNSLVKECEVNPTAPGCQSALGRQSVDFQGNSFNITGNDKASYVPGSMNDGKDGGAKADSPGLQNRSDIAGIIGTELGEKNGKGSTAITGAPGAAGYSGKGVGNPGGSGGASSKGAAPPGGRPPKTGGKPSPGSDSRGVKVKYDGDGSGWKSGAYGSSRRRKKKPSSNSNPFAKLFGDKKKKAGKGGILNFRTPSSSLNKKGGLFQRVSSRYRQVEKEKRLLKYVQK